jgi:hypothetical protein
LVVFLRTVGAYFGELEGFGRSGFLEALEVLRGTQGLRKGFKTFRGVLKGQGVVLPAFERYFFIEKVFLAILLFYF